MGIFRFLLKQDMLLFNDGTPFNMSITGLAALCNNRPLVKYLVRQGADMDLSSAPRWYHTKQTSIKAILEEHTAAEPDPMHLSVKRRERTFSNDKGSLLISRDLTPLGAMIYTGCLNQVEFLLEPLCKPQLLTPAQRDLIDLSNVIPDHVEGLPALPLCMAVFHTMKWQTYIIRMLYEHMVNNKDQEVKEKGMEVIFEVVTLLIKQLMSCDIQVIGRVGETGSLEGPQLYFELRHRGNPQDPLVWLSPRP